jgi:hypothetical protein
MNLGSLEMLSTLESLAEKLSSGHHQNSKCSILLDNNGNKLNGAINRLDKIQQHPYQNNNRSSPNSLSSKFNEK